MRCAPVAIVGDIHGQADKLDAAIAALAEFSGSIIFLGDYIDRGPDSAGVLSRLFAFKEDNTRVRLLLGNHEVTLLRMLAGAPAHDFLAIGGLATVNSYLHDDPAPSLKTFIEIFPPGHLAMLRSMNHLYETDEVLITHCGFNPRRPASRQASDVTLGSFPELFRPDFSAQKLAIFGHYVQKFRTIHEGDNVICIDTGCGVLNDGVLTIYYLPSGNRLYL